MARLSVRADSGVGSITLSPSGRDVALASRSGLYVLDLQSPFTPPRWLPLFSAWEVANCQWCPHPQRPTWVISTCNHKAVVWNVALPSDKAVEYELRGHRRTVTDVNFSPSRPDLVATCSIDTTINVWDLRSPSKPRQTFADFVAGASRARLSAVDPNLLCSSHDNRLVLWDRRMNNRPLMNFRAHDGKINSLRLYGHNGKREVITGSTDRTVKLWDLMGEAEEKPVIEFKTKFPVWRVVESPQGSGILVVPLRGGGNRVSIIDLSTVPPGEHEWPETVAEFGGHGAPVREALWRRSNTEEGYDVLTWSRDCHLRLWDFGKAPGASHLDPAPKRDQSYHSESHEIYRGGHETRGYCRLPAFAGMSKNANAQLDWIAGVQLKSPANSHPPRLSRSATSTSIQLASRRGADFARFSREVTLVSSKFPNVRFEAVDVIAGVCTLTLRGPWGANGSLVGLRVQVIAPPEYPWVPLKCAIEEDPAIPAAVFANMDAFLETTLSELASRGQPAFELCLRYLMGETISLDSIESLDDAIGSSNEEISEEEDDDEIEEIAVDAFASDDSTSDIDITSPKPAKPAIDSTPLPKNCGCVWSPSGVLVCFFNHQSAQKARGPLPLDRIFAASDSDNDSYGSDSENSFMEATSGWSVTAARLTAKPLNHALGVTSDSVSAGVSSGNSTEPEHFVVLQDMKHLMPCRPDIAGEYRLEFGGDPCELATHNAKVAEKYGRHEDSYFWKLLEKFLVTDRSFGGVTYDWSEHPFGSRGLLRDVALHLEKKQNFQLLAGLACVIALYHKLDFSFEESREETTETLFRLETGWDRSVRANIVAHRRANSREGAVLSPWQSVNGRSGPYAGEFQGSEASGASSASPMSQSASSLNLLSQPLQQQQSVQGSSKHALISLQLRTDKSFDYEYFDDSTKTDGYIDWVPSVMRYRQIYAAMLTSWNLHIQRLEQLKFNNAELPGLTNDTEHRICTDARRATCLLCERPARTQVAVCGACSHVMHRQCAEQWWKTASECPSGCGCYCLDDL